MLTAIDEKLLAAAHAVAKNAYAPYSRFHVGVALLSQQGSVYVGCNVENIAYPLGACGERGAIAQMIAAEGSSARIDTIAITGFEHGEIQVSCAPCGGCRQVIAEFGPAQVLYNTTSGYQKVWIHEILPDTFTFGADEPKKG